MARYPADITKKSQVTPDDPFLICSNKRPGVIRLCVCVCARSYKVGVGNSEKVRCLALPPIFLLPSAVHPPTTLTILAIVTTTPRYPLNLTLSPILPIINVYCQN